MKKIILLFIILPALAWAQAEDQNFYLNEQKLSWQKAYSTEKSMEAIYAYFEEHEMFSMVKIENKVLYAKLKPQATGIKLGAPGVPPIMYKTDYNAAVMIQYRPKEGDYVVSMTELHFVGKGDFLKKNEKQAFEEQFVHQTDSKYRPGFLRKPKGLYNGLFSELFLMD